MAGRSLYVCWRDGLPVTTSRGAWRHAMGGATGAIPPRRRHAPVPVERAEYELFCAPGTPLEVCRAIAARMKAADLAIAAAGRFPAGSRVRHSVTGLAGTVTEAPGPPGARFRQVLVTRTGVSVAVDLDTGMGPVYCDARWLEPLRRARKAAGQAARKET
jgi:hypothetical protein